MSNWRQKLNEERSSGDELRGTDSGPETTDVTPRDSARTGGATVVGGWRMAMQVAAARDDAIERNEKAERKKNKKKKKRKGGDGEEDDENRELLPEEPQSPAMKEMTLADIRAAAIIEAREVDSTKCHRLPTWVHRNTDLRLFIEQIDDPRVAASMAVVTKLHADYAETQQLAREVDMGVDGGYFGVSSRTVEGTKPDASAMLRGVDPAVSAFWTVPQSASQHCSALASEYKSRLDILEGLEPIGLPFNDGADGTQSWTETDLSGRIRKLTMQRTIVQDLFCIPSNVNQRHDSLELLQREYFSTPAIHSEFICAKETTRPDHNLLRSTHPFEPDESVGRIGDQGEGVHRIISVNLGIFRFTDHATFSPESHHMSSLLTAYTKYKLLRGNLLELKNRDLYSQIQTDLRQALLLARRAAGLPDVAEAPPPPPPTDAPAEGKKKKKSKKSSASVETDSTTAGGAPQPAAQPSVTSSVQPTFQLGGFTFTVSEAERANLLGRVHSVDKDLDAITRNLQRSVDEERRLLQTMWHSWKSVKSERRDKRHATPPVRPSTQLDFLLRHHRADEEQHYHEEENENILDFVPVLIPGDDPAELVAQANERDQAQMKERHGKPYYPTSLPPRVMASVFVRMNPGQQPIFVGRSEPVVLDSALSAAFNETLEIHATNEPHDIQVQVFEYLTNAHIATFAVPPSMTSKTHIIDANPYGDPKANVSMVLSTSWMTATGHPIEAIEDMFLNGDADPLDPRQSGFVALLRRRYAMKGHDSRDRLRHDATDGTSEHRVAPKPYELSDERLKLLYLRNQLCRKRVMPKDPFEARLMFVRMPATEFETKQMVRKIRGEIAVEEAQAAAAVNSDVALSMGAKDTVSQEKSLELWKARLRQKKLKMKPRKLLDHERLAQIMYLPPVPTLGKVWDKIRNFFIPKAKLRPERDDGLTDAEVEAKLKVGNSQIVVHVMKAEGMPLRTDGVATQVVAEVSFVSKNASSTPQEGPTPSWFETLAVPFKPVDYEETTLSLIDDEIVVSFYDALLISMPTDGASSHPASKVEQIRHERRLLGQVRMPFYSVYQTEKSSVEGQYTVETPRLIMGYNMPAVPPTANLFLSLWPPLKSGEDIPPTNAQLLQAIRATYPTRELSTLYDAALRWKVQMESRLHAIIGVNPLAGNREFKPFVTASNGEPTLMTRYINPTGCRPPESVTSVALAIRFVSLLPFVVDLAQGDAKDVWSTIAEFMEVGGGDYEELALVLVHLLRKISNEPSFLIIGKGDIYAEATFVLTMVNDNWVIIDPRTGVVSQTDDPRCGLSEVSMVVSHNQVWGNVQLSGVPYRMVWNLDDARCWAPMFGPEHDQFVPHATCIQRANVSLGLPCPEDRAIQLEVDVKRKVKNLMREWRNDRTLRFDDGISRHLRAVLEQLEAERSNFASFHQVHVDAEQTAALNSILAVDLQPVGYPVNHAYVNLSEGSGDASLNALFRSVKETAVHEVGALRVRYAIAAYVKAFTEDVFSMWVYVVALIPTPRNTS